jgi:VanZ family protein
MAMAQRQKTLIIALALYWPTIFVLTHIPVPEVVRQAHMSDKSLHFLAYMVLAFLLWSALRPFEKAAWRRPAAWLALAIVMVYALCDEYLQRFVAGRSPDWQDLLANAIGACAGLTAAAVVSFWPGSVIVTGTTIFTLAVFTRANLTRLLPVTSAALNLATYGLFTLLWIGCLDRPSSGQRADRIWSIRSLAGPAALLLVTKVSAIVSGKEIEGVEIVAGAGGIAGAMVIVALWRSLRRRNAKGAGLSTADA